MSDLANLLPLVGIALLFWFLIIRPTTKRQKELARMQAALQVGDEVILTSGVYGVLEAAADDHVRIEVAPGVTIKVARGAIGSIVDRSVAPEPEEN